jgi:Helix-turn-helix domain
MARGRQSSVRLVLSAEEHQPLARWQRSPTPAAGLVRRGTISPLVAAGHSPAHVAEAVGVHRTGGRQWARRFLAQRLDGLADAPGRGATGGLSPGGRHPRGAPGLRTPCSGRPSPVPRGVCRAGAAAHRGRARGRPPGRDPPPALGCTSTEPLASSALAVAHAPPRCRIVCSRRRRERALHASTPRCRGRPLPG